MLFDNKTAKPRAYSHLCECIKTSKDHKSNEDKIISILHAASQPAHFRCYIDDHTDIDIYHDILYPLDMLSAGYRILDSLLIE